MKKALTMLLALAMVFSLAACGGAGNADDNKENGSGNKEENKTYDYPENFDEWTDTDLVNYFRENGLITNEDWITVQNDIEWTQSGGFSAIVSYYGDDASGVWIDFYYLDVPNAIERINEVYDEIKTTHKYEMVDVAPGEYMTPTHMVGKFVFDFSMIVDEETADKAEEVYQELITEYKLTPEF